MSGQEQNKKAPGEFALDLDDSLLEAAVAAVDARMGPAKGVGTITLDDHLGTEEIMAELAATFSQAEHSVERIATEHEEQPLDHEISLDLEPDLLSLADSEMETAAGPPAFGADPEQLTGLLEEGAQSRLELEAQLTDSQLENAALREQLTDLQAQLGQAIEQGAAHKKRAVKLSVLRKRLQDGYDTMALRLEDQRVRLEEWERLLAEGRLQQAKMESERERLKMRHQRETLEIRQYGQDRLFRELLPVLDNLDLTLLHADSTPPDKMVEGVSMVLRHFQQTLDRLGLKRISAVELPFDPNLHEAIRYTPDERKAGSVIELHQAGYQLHERLIRAARVTVSSGPRAPEIAVSEQDEVEPAVTDAHVGEE